MPPQANYIPVVPIGAGRTRARIRPVDRQGIIAGIQAVHIHAQIGVGIAFIRRISQRAGDQQFVIPVVVPGNVMSIHARDGGLVAGCTQEKTPSKSRGKKEQGRDREVQAGLKNAEAG